MPATGAPTTKTIRLNGCTLPASVEWWAIAVRSASGTPAHSFDWLDAGPGAVPDSVAAFAPGGLSFRHHGFVKATAGCLQGLNGAVASLQLGAS